MDVVYLLGTIALYGLLFTLICTFIAGILLFIFFKWNRTFFPNITLMLITAFSSPLKVFTKLLRVDQRVIDSLLIKLMNKVFYIKFAKTAYDERALFLPQCLRNQECPAKLGANGIECVSCARECSVKEAKIEAEKLGYRVFIVPGGGFVKRLVLRHKPKGIVGVACLPEVMLGMDLLGKTRLPGQGVVLLRSGCLNTKVDLAELKTVLTTKG
jgi:hypothetical protein